MNLRKAYHASYYKDNKETYIKRGNLYRRSFDGFLVYVYKRMSNRTKGICKRPNLYIGLSICSKDAFYKWALNNAQYKWLYSAWVTSNFNRKLTPSIDRKDTTKGYNIGNMQFITYSENCRKGAISGANKRRENVKA